MIIFITGVLLIIFSIVLMYEYFSQNEWRASLLELSSELEGEAWKGRQAGVRRQLVTIPVFFLILFIMGGAIILRSSILQSYKSIILLVLEILFLCFLKGVYGLIKASYSRKTRLLNYLYSPYLFAWRRDLLSKYSDQEIAATICKVCNIQDSSLLKENIDLRDFLIALHRKTRSLKEHKVYPKLLEGNISQAKQIWSRY